MSSPQDLPLTEAEDSTAAPTTTPSQESVAKPALINVFGQGSALTNGLAGLNISLDDASACGADGCY